jgi:hypothetical protein
LRIRPATGKLARAVSVIGRDRSWPDHELVLAAGQRVRIVDGEGWDYYIECRAGPAMEPPLAKSPSQYPSKSHGVRQQADFLTWVAAMKSASGCDAMFRGEYKEHE